MTFISHIIILRTPRGVLYQCSDRGRVKFNLANRYKIGTNFTVFINTIFFPICNVIWQDLGLQWYHTNTTVLGLEDIYLIVLTAIMFKINTDIYCANRIVCGWQGKSYCQVMIFVTISWSDCMITEYNLTVVL